MAGMKSFIYFLPLLFLYSCNRTAESTENNQPKSKSELSEVSPELEKTLKCNFETYLEYTGSVPLFKSPNGRIVTYFRFEEDPEYDFGGGFLFKNGEAGWLQIGKDEFYPDFEGCWVQSDFVKIGTTNYDNRPIPLYGKPFKKSHITGYLEEETFLNVLDCNSNWAYVVREGVSGWLPPEFICNNPETNCN